MSRFASLCRRLLLATFVGASLAAPATAGQLDRDNPTPTGWLWYYNQTPAQINAIRAQGYRIASLDVDIVSPLRFSVAFVRNTGTYARASTAWYYGTPSFVESRRAGRRVTALTPYVINNRLYLAAAFVANTGSNAKSWGYYYGTASFISSRVSALGGRIVDLDSYVISGTRYYTAVIVRNSGTDLRSWWWYLNVTQTQVIANQLKNGARVTDLEYIGSGRYNAVMVRKLGMPHGWWYADTSVTNLIEKINQNGARLISLQRVGSRFHACMINNSNDLTTKVGDIMRRIPGVTGIYMKEVNGPVHVWINGDRVYEPASSLKTLHHVHAMKQVALNRIRLTTGIRSYQGVFTACPSSNLPVKTEPLANVLAPMMKISNNIATYSIETWFGRNNINATATALGMSRTRINHHIGCGLPANRFTLQDAGKLFEAVANGYVGTLKNNLYFLMTNDMLGPAIDSEAAKMSIPNDVRDSFKIHAWHAWKGGSYTVSNREHRSHVGWFRLPHCIGGKIVMKQYVYGNFINDATSTTNFSLFSVARDEMRREMIRQALATWRNAKFNGSVVTIGTGCTGSNGTLRHFSTGTPEIGRTQYLQLSNAAKSSVAVMQLGFSSTQWGPFRLPLDLTVFGATGCKLYNDPVVSFPKATNASGWASIAWAHPNEKGFVGVRFYTQYLCLDRPANQLGLTYSNGLRTTVGGVLK